MSKTSKTRKNKPSAEVAAPAPRDRMVRSAAALMSERGLTGTSFTEVIERSGAPRGSIYHHFPNGKDSVAAEAITLVGENVLGFIRYREGSTPEAVVKRFIDAWRTVLLKSDFTAGCAIAAVANERIAHPALGDRAAAVFESWEKELETTLISAGLKKKKARSAAALILAALEGVLIVCRARREIGPLDAVSDALVAFVA